MIDNRWKSYRFPRILLWLTARKIASGDEVRRAEGEEGAVAEKADLIDMTADIVSAYVGHNAVAPEELAGLIHKVFGALTSASTGSSAADLQSLIRK